MDCNRKINRTDQWKESMQEKLKVWARVVKGTKMNGQIQSMFRG